LEEAKLVDVDVERERRRSENAMHLARAIQSAHVNGELADLMRDGAENLEQLNAVMPDAQDVMDRLMDGIQVKQGHDDALSTPLLAETVVDAADAEAEPVLPPSPAAANVVPARKLKQKIPVAFYCVRSHHTRVHCALCALRISTCTMPVFEIRHRKPVISAPHSNMPFCVRQHTV